MRGLRGAWKGRLPKRVREGQAPGAEARFDARHWQALKACQCHPNPLARVKMRQRFDTPRGGVTLSPFSNCQEHVQA